MSINENDYGFSSEPEFFDAPEYLLSTPGSISGSSLRAQIHSDHTSPLSVRTRQLPPITESSEFLEASDDSEDRQTTPSPSSDPPLQNPLDPIVNGAFESFEDLRNELNTITKCYGYALRISGSHKDKKSGVVWKKQLQCDMGGISRDRIQEEARKRKRPSRLTDCPWRGYARMIDNKWSLFVKNDIHNHRMTSAAAHPVLRRLAPTVTDFIENEARRRLPVYKTLNELRAQDSHLVIDKKDIYNARAKNRRNRLQGKTPLQGLFDEIKGRSEWDCRGFYDEWDRLELFFFRHRQSQQLLMHFYYVLFVDCTYKTNRYNMPLLVITGITCCKKTFFVGFCFLANETESLLVVALRAFRSFLFDDGIVMLNSFQNNDEEDGVIKFGLDNTAEELIEAGELRAGELQAPVTSGFAPITFVSDSAPALMNAIERVFPEQRHIICQWHMNKNIQSRLDTYFGNSDEERQAKENWKRLWFKVLSAHSEMEFDGLNEELKEQEPNSQFKTPENPTPLHSSVYKTYLAGDLKYKIVQFGVARIPHFGQKASSAGEGSNSKLKDRLYSSQLPLPQIVENIGEMIKEQFEDILNTHEKAMINIPSEHRQTGIFRYLIGYISPKAIKLMYDQYRIFSVYPWVMPKCTGVWSSIYGLPCKHHIQHMLFTKHPLRLCHIHPHWKFDATIPDDVEIPIERRLQEPVQVKRKKRTKKGTVTLDKSRKRIPSRFEITAWEKRQEAQQARASQGSQLRHNEELQRQIEEDNYRQFHEADQRVYNEVTAICNEYDPPLSRRDAVRERAMREGMLTRPLEGVLSLAYQKGIATSNPQSSVIEPELHHQEAVQQTNNRLGRGKRQKRPARK